MAEARLLGSACIRGQPHHVCSPQHASKVTLPRTSCVSLSEERSLAEGPGVEREPCGLGSLSSAADSRSMEARNMRRLRRARACCSVSPPPSSITVAQCPNGSVGQPCTSNDTHQGIGMGKVDRSGMLSWLANEVRNQSARRDRWKRRKGEGTTNAKNTAPVPAASPGITPAIPHSHSILHNHEQTGARADMALANKNNARTQTHPQKVVVGVKNGRLHPPPLGKRKKVESAAEPNPRR